MKPTKQVRSKRTSQIWRPSKNPADAGSQICFSRIWFKNQYAAQTIQGFAWSPWNKFVQNAPPKSDGLQKIELTLDHRSGFQGFCYFQRCPRAPQTSAKRPRAPRRDTQSLCVSTACCIWSLACVLSCFVYINTHRNVYLYIHIHIYTLYMHMNIDNLTHREFIFIYITICIYM
jgi:hypothetical protein